MVAFPLLACVAIAPVRGASVINFDDLALSNYGVIPEDYGSNPAGAPNVSVSYRTLNLDLSVFSERLLLWNDRYGDLSRAAIAETAPSIAEVRFDAAPGYEVELQSFWLGGYPLVDRIATVLRVVDAAGDVLWDAANTVVLGAGGTHSEYALNLRGSTLRIQWGDDWNVGIDNIAFDQVEATAVPEPASLVTLSLAGVAAGLLVLRRKTK